MLEAIEVGHRLSKRAFHRIEPRMRQDLLAVQRDLAGTPLSVVILVDGPRGAGKGDLVNLLLSWMDARGIRVHALGDETQDEAERPFLWRFWRLLPAAGRMGIFFGGWYSDPIDRLVKGKGEKGVNAALNRIVQLETMLAQENVILLKFWLHLTEEQQYRRLRKLERDRDMAWRVRKSDWKLHGNYARYTGAAEHVLRQTNLPSAPWHLVEARDAQYRTIVVMRTIRNSLREAISRYRALGPSSIQPEHSRPARNNILSSLDQSAQMSEEEYAEKISRYTRKLAIQVRRLPVERRSLVLVFEGPDASGKGGAIRRVISALDARQYQVVPVAAPTDEERAHPYLWRFWREIPRVGRIVLFDRSWYGRVLVERVEGFAPSSDWMRAYSEINAFEEQLTQAGIIVLKFWLQTTPDIQLERFKDRQATPYKQYKITEEDWRNRDKWDSYISAACDMVEKTGSEQCPWVLVPANDKSSARVHVLRTIVKRLERELD